PVERRPGAGALRGAAGARRAHGRAAGPAAPRAQRPHAVRRVRLRAGGAARPVHPFHPGRRHARPRGARRDRARRGARRRRVRRSHRGQVRRADHEGPARGGRAGKDPGEGPRGLPVRGRRMMKGALPNILEAVGRTPIVKLQKVASHVAAEIYVKCEYLNPAGSMKDRGAMNIIADAERRGLLRPGGTIVEATSGNTGMGLAMVAAVRGYHCIFVMPDKMSQEKIASLRAFGAKVVICPTAVEPEDPRSYYSVSRRIVEETPGAFYANQYHNPANPEAHYRSTAPELWEQTGGEFDVFAAGMGTGGTISGCARYFKERKPGLKILGVDPIGSLYYEYVKTGRLTKPFSYYVEGIGEDFLPSTMNLKIIDEIVRVDDKECFLMTRRLTREEG